MGDLLHHHIRRDKHDSTNVDDIKEQRQTMKMYRQLILITKGTHRFMGECLFHVHCYRIAQRLSLSMNFSAVTAAAANSSAYITSVIQQPMTLSLEDSYFLS